MDWQVEYYKKENGEIPVLEYLLTLDSKMRAKAFSEIELLQKHGVSRGEPNSISLNLVKFLFLSLVVLVRRQPCFVLRTLII